MLSGGTQRRALPRLQSEEEFGSNLQPVAFNVTLCAPAPRLASIIVFGI